MNRFQTRVRPVIGVLLACLIGFASVLPALAQQWSELTEEDTAFLKVVRSSRVADVQAALDAGARPTPWAVLEATKLYRTDVLKLLISAGADVDGRVRSDEGPGMDITPLIAAAGAGRPEAVKVLLDAGADPMARGRFFGLETTPLEAASTGGKKEVMELLAEAGATLGESEQSSTSTGLALMNAVEDGDVDLLRSLIAAGADVNARSVAGITPLSHAAGYPKRTVETLERMVAALIEAGADVNIANDDGTTPFMMAARRGAPRIMTMILDAGADPDARDASGNHAIFYADGYDPVADIVTESSGVMKSHRSARSIQDGGTYPPGSYACPCEKSGSPPRTGVPAQKSGVQSDVNTRVRGPRGFNASVLAPECAPVEFTEPGDYSGYTVACTETWTVSEHSLRQTTGEVTTLSYIHTDADCADTVFNFSIAPEAPEAGRPDRCRDARLDLLLPEADDQFAFDDDDPGRVEIPFLARVEPEDCAEELIWDFPDIEGTEKYESAAGASWPEGTGLLVYEKLPESNDDFGRITLRASMDGQAKDVEVQLFYDPRAKNHPGEDEGETPNWFYYWAQTEAYSWGNIAGIEPTYMERIPSCSGGDALVGGRYDYDDDAVYLSDAVVEKPCAAPRGAAAARGIDCYAETLRHEGTHRQELRNWWPIEVETASGATVSLDPIGCKPADLTMGAFARWQEWVYGLVGEEDRAWYRGVDSDYDMVPDAVEDAYSARGCDKENPASCEGRPAGIDVELNAYTEGWKWPGVIADKQDWSRCGKQWKKGGCD